MRFETKKDFTFLVVFVFLFLLYSGISVFSIVYQNDYSVLWIFPIVLVLIALLFLSILKTTYYIFEENELICKSLFLKRIIPYSTIRKVEKQKGFYAGL